MKAKAISPSQRRFDELRRRVELLTETYGARFKQGSRLTDDDLDLIVGGAGVTFPKSLKRAVERRLFRAKIPAQRHGFYGEGALPLALWAMRHENNLDVCAAFAVEVVLTRRAMTAMAEVASPVVAVTNGVATAGTMSLPFHVPGYRTSDLDRLLPLTEQTRRVVESESPVQGAWKPTKGDPPHLYGGDPLCPPVEALALVAGWFNLHLPPVNGVGLDTPTEPRPEVVTLGLGPFAGPTLLARMMPFHDLVVDGAPFDTRSTVVSTAPVGVVVNLASENALSLALALVPQHDGPEDLFAVKKVLDGARREIDGFGDTCAELLQRLQTHRSAKRPVIVLGGPATHSIFANLAEELGLVTEPLYRRDTSRRGIFVSNPAGRSNRGIPHLPGVVVSLWRWR